MNKVKNTILLLMLLLVVLPVQAQKKSKTLYSIAFYNVENLFDTYHDEGKNDYEYLPEGRKEWTYDKYKSKLLKLDQVLGELSRDQVPEGPIAIGLAEVENFKVIHDLLIQPNLAKDNYQYVHYEGPDMRGIDCALIYNPKLFLPIATKLVPSVPFQGDTIHKTRGFLVVRGNVIPENDELTLIVNHWPSRGAEAPVRMHAAKQVKEITDSLYRDNKNAKIIIMGDLNDDPMDPSLTVGIGAKKYKKEVKEKGFYNPWWSILEDDGVGTLMYRGKWNLFDQILISNSLLKENSKLKYKAAEVFKRDYLFQKEGKYKGSPLRTHGGKLWLDGYSDHLPTIIYLQ